MAFLHDLNAIMSNKNLSIDNTLRGFLPYVVTLPLSELRNNKSRVENAVRNMDIGMMSPAPVSSFTDLEKHQIQERFDTLRLAVLEIQGFLQEDKTLEEWEDKKAYVRYLLDK